MFAIILKGHKKMIQFKIDAQLPSLNDYINKLKSPNGKRLGAAFKKQTDELCEKFMLPVKIKARDICKKPVLIHFHWEEKSHRRDLDNISSAKKFILDAMQKCGILDNDNYKHVKGIYDTFVFGERSFVTVEIYSLNEIEDVFRKIMVSERVRIANEIVKLNEKG